MEEPYVPHPYQQEKIDAILAEPTRAAIIADQVGAGKAQPLDSLVLTPEGFKTMGEMKVGDFVVTPDGGRAEVLGVFPQGERPVYRVTLKDGRSILADEDHLWTVEPAQDVSRKLRVLTTKQIKATLKRGAGSRWQIPRIAGEAIDFGVAPEGELDPYLVGLIIGDGGLTTTMPYYSGGDLELLDAVASLIPDEVNMVHAGAYDYRLTAGHRGGRENPLTHELRKLGLMGKHSREKFVPEIYKNAPAATRLAILQGIFDTDGHPSKVSVDYVSASRRLVEDVIWLTRSLGGKAGEPREKRVNGVPYWRTTATLPVGVQPFRLTRKREALTVATKYAVRALPIRSVEYVGMMQTQCIYVDHPDHEYVTDHFTRTHNTLVASEIAIQAGWKRALFIGIGDTFGQWKASLERQSRGAVTLRNMHNRDKEGKRAYADFLAGEPGFYFATIHFLNAQDFEHRYKLDINGERIEKLDKKTGLPTGKFERERKHLQTFLKMSKRKGGGLDAVIYDEAHMSSAHDSITRKTLVTLRAQDGAQPWKIALSATWAGNSFENAWSLPRWCWPELVPAFWNWRDEWCATEDQYVPGKSKPVSKVVGEKEPGKWVASLPMYTRWENPDVPPEPIKVRIPPTPQQAAQYADLERDLMTWAMTEAAQGREPLVIDAPGGLYMRLKQLALAELSVTPDGDVFFAPNAASAKLNVLRGVLDMWPGQRVVLFTDSQLFAELTVARMRQAGYNAVAWTGATSKKERERIKQAFIDGEYQYLVATVQSAGTGIDGWQRVCSKVVWLNVPDGDPKLFDQALGRVFRQGRTLEYGEFMHVQLVMAESQDEKIAETLVAKAIAIQAAVGAHNLVDAA